MRNQFWFFLLTLLSSVSCREIIGNKPSAIDIEMEKRIIGNWIFDNGNPPIFDSTILFFNFSNEMSIIDYGIHDTISDYRYKIRDSVLILISFSNYPSRYEIDYKINYLDNLFLTISRYRNFTLQYTKTYRKFYAN